MALTVERLVDVAAWNQVLRFVPQPHRGTTQAEALAGFEAVAVDKHFVAERRFDAALSALSAAEDDLAASDSKQGETTVAPRARGGLAGDVLMTVMGVRMARDFLIATRGFQICRSKCADSRAIMAEADMGNSSWKPVSVDKKTGYGTYYRGEPGMSTHSFKVVGVVNAEVVALACVLLELDLYKEWFPFCYFSTVVREESRFHKSSRFAIRLPWPLANREVAITGFGHDDLDDGRVIVKACTDPALGEAASRKGNVMAELKLGGFYIEPVAKRDTRITFFMNIDPHIPHLPTAVLNWTSGNLMWVMLHELRKAAVKAMDPKSIYAQRRAERPDVYEYFTERAAEVLRNLPDEAP